MAADEKRALAEKTSQLADEIEAASRMRLNEEAKLKATLAATEESAERARAETAAAADARLAAAQQRPKQLFRGAHRGRATVHDASQEQRG